MLVLIRLLLLALLPGTMLAHAQEHLEADHVRIQWLAPEQLASGTSTTLGIYFEVDPEWHVYWLNPGDSGAAPRFDFSVEGASLGSIQWPLPSRLPVAHLTNIGYEGDVAYLFELTPDANADAVKLTLNLEWLVCKEDCIPGFGVLTLERPVAGSHSQWPAAQQALRDAFLARVPQAGELAPWQPNPAEWFDSAGELRLTLPGAGADNTLQVYPMAGDRLSPAAPEVRVQGENRQFIFNTQPGMSMPGQLGFVVAQDDRAWAFPALPVQAGTSPAPLASEPRALWLLLLSALAGGLILNLMPCVFPVLSIKLFSLINHQGQDANQVHQRLREGLLYSAGVMTTFAALGAVFLLLRAGGAAVGWGFQLQSPAVVLGLALLFWVMALSFLGAVEFGHSLMRLAGQSNNRSAFGTGVLAVFVAAPCTGPMMGAALGASATLPATQAMTIFLGLGAGLAAPFLLLAASPALSSRLPRPGPWMETLRQFLAFPLFATVLWLLWVLGRLTGESGWLLGGGLLLIVSFAFWLGRPRVEQGERGTRPWFALALALVAIVFSLRSVQTLEPEALNTGVDTQWQPFSQARLQQARAEGQAVFIDYTAAWCITCQVNKAAVLDTRAASALFEQQQVLLLRADWTRYDPEITESLAALGRNSVPVYAFYPAGGGEVHLLPQILNLGLLQDLF